MAANPEFLGTLDAGSGDTGAADTGAAANADNVNADAGAGAKPEAQEAAVTTNQAATDATAARQDTVPQGALHEARAQVKALKQQIAQLEAQPKLTTEDSALLRELREQRATAKAEAAPDFLADPKGYVDAQVKTAREQAEAAKKEGEEARKQSDEQRSRQEAYQRTAVAETQFLQTTPDYPQALEHIRGIQRQQLTLAHPDATPEQISAHIAFVEMQTANAMLAQGRNPAEYAYAVAQTWGYKAAARAATPAQQAAKRVDKEAARSMGSGGADASDEDGGDGVDGMPEFAAAKAERFARRK